MSPNSNNTSSWFRGTGSILTLLGSLIMISGIIFSSVQANHAGDAEANNSQDAIMLGVTSEMVDIAQSILATVENGPGGIENAVGYNRQELLALDFNDEARTNYVYWPYLRKGLPFDFMNAQQKSLVHDLIHSALSARGYLSAIQVMQMEEILASTEVIGFPRGTENYTLAIFCVPANDNQWGWRFEGHHLSLNFTVAPGEVSVTPSFFGASPAEIRTGNLTGFRNQREVHEYGLALVNALNDQQRSVAIQAENPPFDIVSGTLNKPVDSWESWKDLPQIGIAISSLNDAQKAITQSIVDEVVSTYRPEISDAYLQQIDINEIRFSWFGGTEDGDPHYYRLDSPDFFFEYDLVQGNGNHVHAVWRSKDGDYGTDLLMQHRMGN